MKIPPPHVLFLSLAVVCASSARAEDPLAALLAQHPGARVHHMEGRPAYIYGAPMTRASTPEAAAAAFLQQHGRAFGVGDLELQPSRWIAATPNNSNLKIFGYQQKIRGVPVYGSLLRVGVRLEPTPAVVYSAGRLAGEPTIGVYPPIVPAQLASIFATAHPGYGTSVAVGEPELVVLRGDGRRADAWAWRVPVEDTSSPIRDPRSFFVETRLGSVIHVVDEFHFSPGQVTGSVSGLGTDAQTGLPHDPQTNPPVWQPTPRVLVLAHTPGGTYTTFADESGVFVFDLPNANEQVTIEARLGPHLADAGQYVKVVKPGGDSLGGCGTFTAPTALQTSVQAVTPATVTLEFPGDPQNDADIAQVNAVTEAHRCREYFVSRTVTDGPFLLDKIRVTVNLNFSGIANYRPASSCNGVAVLIFAMAGQGALNNCYSGVFPHEYGHHVTYEVMTDGWQTGAFFEGYGAVTVHIMNNDPIQGRGLWGDPGAGNMGHPYFGPPGNTGDPRQTPYWSCQYPIPPYPTWQTNPPLPESFCVCDTGTGGSHPAGQVLAGVWVRIMQGFQDAFGASGVEDARQLHVSWTFLTAGGAAPCDSAHCGTLAEVMTAASNYSGEHKGIINDAFAAHSIENSTCD